MNLQTITELIEGIEAEEPTLKNCTQLASLYIVKKHLENIKASDVEKEIRDNAWKLSNVQVRRAAAQQASKAVDISADDFDQG